MNKEIDFMYWLVNISEFETDNLGEEALMNLYEDEEINKAYNEYVGKGK